MTGPEDTEGNPSDNWDPEKADEFLTMERTVSTEQELSNVELTKQLLEQAAPNAAMSMIHLSRHASNENTRMNSAKWVVEFATQLQTEDGRAAWEKMLPSVVSEAEHIAVAAAAQGDDGGFSVGD